MTMNEQLVELTRIQKANVFLSRFHWTAAAHGWNAQLELEQVDLKMKLQGTGATPADAVNDLYTKVQDYNTRGLNELTPAHIGTTANSRAVLAEIMK